MAEMADVRFMTAEEKRAVLRDWRRFLITGLTWHTFTERLYHHLTLHCSFIAHYSRGGFYNTYFQHGDDVCRFMSQFDKREAGADGIPKSIEYGATWWGKGDHADINREMIEVATEFIPHLEEQATKDQRSADIETARQLLCKHGITLQSVETGS